MRTAPIRRHSLANPRRELKRSSAQTRCLCLRVRACLFPCSHTTSESGISRKGTAKGHRRRRLDPARIAATEDDTETSPADVHAHTSIPRSIDPGQSSSMLGDVASRPFIRHVYARTIALSVKAGGDSLVVVERGTPPPTPACNYAQQAPPLSPQELRDHTRRPSTSGRPLTLRAHPCDAPRSTKAHLRRQLAHASTLDGRIAQLDQQRTDAFAPYPAHATPVGRNPTDATAPVRCHDHRPPRPRQRLLVSPSASASPLAARAIKRLVCLACRVGSKSAVG